MGRTAVHGRRDLGNSISIDPSRETRYRRDNYGKGEEDEQVLGQTSPVENSIQLRSIP
jgi:hypothetical protein